MSLSREFIAFAYSHPPPRSQDEWFIEHLSVLEECIENGVEQTEARIVGTQGRFKFGHTLPNRAVLESSISTLLDHFEHVGDSDTRKDSEQIDFISTTADKNPELLRLTALYLIDSMFKDMMQREIEAGEDTQLLFSTAGVSCCVQCALAEHQIRLAISQAKLLESHGLYAKAYATWKAACHAADVVLRNTALEDDLIRAAYLQIPLFQHCGFDAAKAGLLKDSVLHIERGRQRLLHLKVEQQQLFTTIRARADFGDPIVKVYFRSIQALESLSRSGGFANASMVERALDPRSSYVLRAFSDFNEEEWAASSHLMQSVASQFIFSSDLVNRNQFHHVLPRQLAGENPAASPFYNKEAFEQLQELFAKQGDLLRRYHRPEAKSSEPEEFFRLRCAEMLLGTVDDELTWEKLTAGIDAAAGLDMAFVYIVVTGEGTVAVILRPNGGDGLVTVSRLELAEINLDVLNMVLDGNQTKGRMGWFDAHEQRHVMLSTWMSVVVRTLDFLYAGFMEKLCTHLKELGCTEAVLIPTGRIAALPLHASALQNNERSLNFSYAPSLRAWQRAQRTARRNWKHTFIGICNPSPSALPQLQDASDEITIISSRFFRRIGHVWAAPRVLAGEMAQREVVRQFLEERSHTIAHIACHAESDAKDPLQAGIFLSGDNKLKLVSMGRSAGLGTEEQYWRLAVVAACETGLDRSPFADESLSLAQAFLNRGYAGVIATLCAVPGVSTSLTLIRFYSEWLDRGLSPSAALTKAQIWMRESSMDEKRELFHDGTYPECPESVPPDARAAIMAARSRFLSELTQEDMQAHLSHPYSWGGLFLSGC